MNDVFDSLFTFEREELLEALRRDVRAEQEKAKSDRDCHELHRQNARNSIRLLEALNPKAGSRSKVDRLRLASRRPEMQPNESMLPA